jgi:dynein heavy chain
MPYSFKIVSKYAEMLFDQERREVHATPKSFLELIKLFKSMQSQKEGQLIKDKEKYETGV